MINNRLDIGGAAFECYARMRAGETQQVMSFIKDVEGQIRSGQVADTLDLAYWLWIVGEFASATGDRKHIEHMQVAASFALSRLAAHWNEPQAHWLGGSLGEPAVYLSNLAIIYGAVLAVQPHWTKDLRENMPTDADVQRLLKDIRELLFAKFIKDGKVVSRLGSREIYGDIILAAVPFGMLGIEDRILIEALFVVERELVGKGVRFSGSDMYYGGCERPDLSSLLAWYYAEKGDMAKAKQLMEHVSRLAAENGLLYEVDPDTANEPIYYDYALRQGGGKLEASTLAQAMHSIAAAILHSKLTGAEGDSSGAIHIQHQPTGTDDPYMQFHDERAPRYPEAGELVFLRMTTAPFHASAQSAAAEYSINGGEFSAVPMTVETAQDGEKFWQAPIGRFEYGQEVAYRFRVEEGGAQTASETYYFRVRDWQPLGPVTGMVAHANRVELQYACLPGMTAAPVLSVARRNGSAAEFRLQWSDQPAATGSLSSNGMSIPLDGYSLNVNVEQSSFGIHACDSGESTVLQTASRAGQVPLEVLTDGSGRVYKARLNFALQEGERTFGMGERYTRMEYRGCTVDNYVYNEYRSQGLKTYMPVPFYMSSAGYGLYLDTTLYSKFHFGSTLSDVLEIEVDLNADQPDLQWHLFVGEPLAMIGQLSGVTAKPVLPPKWAFGPWMSSNNWDSQAEVASQVALTNQYEIPSTVIVLEQWSDEATFYIFNDAQYQAKDGNEALRYDEFEFPAWGRWPNPKQMVADLHANGLKVLLWQIPIHKHMYGIAHEQRDADERAMLENGYAVKYRDGDPYRIPYNWFKDCLVIDFTNEAGRKWWFDKRKYLMDEVGIDGFKTDGGECIFGHDVMFSDGSTGETMRNRYPLDYIGSYYDFVQEQTNGDGITFSRAGYSGAQRYPLHWAGDERSTYEAFRASIIAGLTSGMSGIPFWGWDLGGFHGDIPTAELFVRATQMAAFCPVMQYHAETKGEFNQDRTPWNIAERTGKPEVIGLYKKYADIRMNLLPYVYDQAMISSESGAPMMRAMCVAYPQDRASYDLTTQYMFGDSLLIAPITEEGHYSKRVYFPEGQWISLFNVEKHAGGISLSVSADLDHIPVYMRENSVVALNLDSTMQIGAHVGNRVDSYDRLTFMIFAVGEVCYRFRDDMGNMVTVEGERSTNGLKLRVISNVQAPIHFMIRDVPAIQDVISETVKWTKAGSLAELYVRSYFIREKDVILTVPAGDETLDIRIAVGGEPHANK